MKHKITINGSFLTISLQHFDFYKGKGFYTETKTYKKAKSAAEFYARSSTHEYWHGELQRRMKYYPYDNDKYWDYYNRLYSKVLPIFKTYLP